MKQLILSVLLIAGITISGCTQTGSKNEVIASGNEASRNDASGNGATGNDATGKVIQMDKAMFIKNVFNYEASPDKWVYAGNKPCIIDFYADWCGPCKKVAPVMVQLAEQYKDQIVIYKVNTDKEKELAALFNIRSIPSIMFCPAEGQPTMSMGALPKAQYEEMIGRLLLKDAGTPAQSGIK